MATVPIALAIAGTVAAVAGATVAGVGAYRTAQAQESSAKFNEKMAGYNSDLANQEAQDAEARGKLEEKQTRQRTAAIIGTQSAELASTGVDVGSGSARDLLVDTAGLGEFDAGVVKANAAREAYNARVRAFGAGASGSLEGMQASSISPGTSLASSALNSASSVADRWYMYNKYK